MVPESTESGIPESWFVMRPLGPVVLQPLVRGVVGLHPYAVRTRALFAICIYEKAQYIGTPDKPKSLVSYHQSRRVVGPTPKMDMGFFLGSVLGPRIELLDQDPYPLGLIFTLILTAAAHLAPIAESRVS